MNYTLHIKSTAIPPAPSFFDIAESIAVEKFIDSVEAREVLEKNYKRS